MLDVKIIKLINNRYPNITKDIGESMGLLNIVFDELMNKLNNDITNALNERNYDLASDCLKLHEYVNEAYKENFEIIEYVKNIEADEMEDGVTKEFAQGENKVITSYGNYAVDQSADHTLYESFEYKRPKGFKLRGITVESNSWANVLIETCEILYAIDSSIFADFANDKNMNGKTRSYFSVTDSNIRKPKKLESGNIYIETNLSANSIKQIIIKMLKKYQIKLQDFVVYFKED